MRFVTRKVRSLYRADLLSIVVREVARYKLDLVGLREARWGKGGMVAVGDYNFF